MQPIKVVIVATHDLTRSGIRMLVQHHAQTIEVVASFSSLQQGEAYLKENRANVLVLDDALPGTFKPKEVVSRLLEVFPLMRIVIISDYLNANYVQRVIDCGASGFMFKQDRLEDTLAAGILTVAEGHIFLSPLASALPYGHQNHEELNATDLEVLQLLAHGYTVQEIAARVDLVQRSVYRIRGKLKAYLNIPTNELLVDAARTHGLLHPGWRLDTSHVEI